MPARREPRRRREEERRGGEVAWLKCVRVAYVPVCAYTHMHSSGRLQCPCCSSHPGRQRAETSKKKSKRLRQLSARGRSRPSRLHEAVTVQHTMRERCIPRCILAEVGSRGTGTPIIHLAGRSLCISRYRS